MSLVVLLGGARSGKSRMAETMARASGHPVTYVATAEALDDEMVRRINRHKADRAESWTTLEVPKELATAIHSVAPTDTIVIDCLTLWVSNILEGGGVESDAAELAQLCAVRTGLTIVVTNEVGSGVVPVSALGREFRDVAGRVNQIFVEASAEAALVVAGRALPLLTTAFWQKD